MIDLVSDLQEEILLRLPLKSILKFKTLSKQWRSILESTSFSERRPKKKLQFLAAAVGNFPTVRHPSNEEEEEVEMFYLDSDFATRPSLSCDGLVCIPVPGWINILNPSTREILRFTSGFNCCFKDVLGYLGMGFGKDKANGNYKVVRLFFWPNYYGEILDINIGEWRKLRNPLPLYVGHRLKSACVNGSIYWLEISSFYKSLKILVLDLYTEEFRHIRTPPLVCKSGTVANLEDRLVVATVDYNNHEFKLHVWTMDAQEETWTKTYSFPLFSSTNHLEGHSWEWCMPLAVSKRGNLYFSNKKNQLHRYCPETGLVRSMTRDICVISPFVENLLPLRRSGSVAGIRTFGFRESRIFKFCRRIELSISDALEIDLLPIEDVLLITIVVALVVFW